MPQIEQVRQRLEREPRVREKLGDVRVSLTGRVVVLEGTVERLATKRVAARVAAEALAGTDIEDRVRVRARRLRHPSRVLRHVVDSITQDPYLDERSIEVTMEDGVVTLSGRVPSLAAKRLAGVLTWWVPGVEDVRNRLAVVPPEEDSDDEIREAIITALDKDPLVDHTRIAVGVHDGVVTLRGTVTGEAERECALEDAWMVWGVRDVNDAIEVRA
jgi:osmotically-inducible protein OsmY